MKVIFKTRRLKQILKIQAPNIFLKAHKNKVTVSITNLETSFEGCYDASIEKEGAIALNAKELDEAVLGYPGEIIAINAISDKLIATGTATMQSHFLRRLRHLEGKIIGMGTNDFPETPSIKDVGFFKVNSYSLKQMIKRQKNDIGLFMNDMSLSMLVSTDGSRLIKVDYELDKDMLIPKQGLKLIPRFLSSDRKIFADVGISQHHFIVKEDNETIITRLLEGDKQ